ncbi:hypothetical protein PG985_008318 [Apiospora marii]|uniref:uncharacterized protein n=1 Tax=Apiospora marii TaxID=335849 RepID=UPI0031308194
MAELALAIVPLCVATIKGGGVILKKCKELRKHSKEIERLRKHFRYQRDAFLDECETIFQQFLDEELASTLIYDAEHHAWSTSQLDEKIKSHLGDRFGRFEKVIQEIYQHIMELDECLNASAGDAERPDRKLKQVEVAKYAINTTGNKSKYEAMIADFKMSNHELKNIRRMSAGFHGPHLIAQPRKEPLVALPSSYRHVSHNSKSFHTALITSWSCTRARHTGHEARLFLDHRPDESFRVVVRQRTYSIHMANDTSVDVLVRSKKLTLDNTSQPTVFREDSTRKQTIKSKGVRFADDCSSQQPGPSRASNSIQLSTAAPINLGSSGDMCTQLCTQTMSARYICYLDSSNQVRHNIHPVCDENCDHNKCLSQTAMREPARLDSIFDSTVEQSRLSVNQQLRLALKLVNGILQFASTPWLQALWYLKDLSFFKIDDNLPRALATLHTSSEISEQGRCELEMLDLNDELIAAQRSHGISNLSLYCLGMALLQIGRWKLLPTDDISEVRRIAEGHSELGPVYQRITQQCLECNFASSKDLSDPDLKDAIYRDVVCRLEGIINAIEGGGGTLR